MFGLGIWEIAAIALVIVVFVKPSELPNAARTAGRVVRRIQTGIARAKAEMRQVSTALERTAAGHAASSDGAAAERTASGRDRGAPPDDRIHPMRTEPPADEQDAGARPGYNADASSGDAAER